MLVVLDDDPTGAQALANVRVLIRWDHDSLRSVEAEGHTVVHLLTNTRALEPNQAYETVRSAGTAAATSLDDADVILRGDSTLRGHVFEEYLGLRDALRLPEFSPLLLAPALPDAGRVTVDGVHWLVKDGRRISLAQTEYARDPAFEYHSARLVEWAEERSDGYFQATRGLEVGLDELRASGDSVLRVLESLAQRGYPAVCAVDAETVDDLKIVSDGLRAARAARVPFVTRCAPALVGTLSGATATRHVAIPASSNGVLVLCGSHVPTTQAQVESLVQEFPAAVVELDAELLTSLRGADQEVDAAAWAASHRLRSDGLAIVMTSRRPLRLGLDESRTVASNLARVVSKLETLPGIILTKGGVTSAITLQEGVQASAANVVGPVVDGVSLWQVQATRPARTPIWWLVFPGNVGSPGLLLTIVQGILSASDHSPRSVSQADR